LSPSGDMPITPIFFEDRSIPDSAVLSVISPFEPQSELERLQHWLNSRLEPFLGLAITDEAGAAIGRTVRFCIGAYLRHNVLPSHWYEVLGHVNVILSDDEEDFFSVKEVPIFETHDNRGFIC